MAVLLEKLHFVKGRSTRKCNCATIAFIVVALLILIILLSVFIPRRSLPETLPSFVVLPLYSYPEKAAWEPLQNAISTNPNVNFLIILNPEDGPGSDEYPQEDYLAAIQNLTIHTNVQLIGYVRTGWATRDESDVVADISTYSGWAGYISNTTDAPSIAVHGIFFDETPHVYSEEAAQYLRRINEIAKNSIGILQNRTVIHNPGTIIDERLDDPATDINVVFEDSYKAYRKKKADLNELNDDRSRHCYMIHSVPAMSTHSLKSFVGSISHHAQALFITNLDKDFYKSFGSNWPGFVEILAH